MRAAALIHDIPALEVAQPYARDVGHVHHVGHGLHAHAVDGATASSSSPAADALQCNGCPGEVDDNLCALGGSERLARQSHRRIQQSAVNGIVLIGAKR
jgi:hypothetical protein